jgi:hypothetical protein
MPRMEHEKYINSSIAADAAASKLVKLRAARLQIYTTHHLLCSGQGLT